MSSPAPPLTTGSRLVERYELVRHIASGGMADVWEAIDEQLRRPVAVKVFRGAAPADRARFEAEAVVLAALNHPGLVHVYDAGEHGGDAFLVLELVEGPTLAARLASEGPLPAPEVAELGAALADALAYVHERGVVHRDVTPANALCGPGGRARLADFGIARLVDTTRLTATATTVGTPSYMAPEQVQGHDVTPAADVYALGLVLLELLTGRKGFPGSAQETAVARLVRPPDTGTGVPAAWQALLADMTDRAPSNRPSAVEVRDRLRALTASAADVTVAGGLGAAAPTQAMATSEPGTSRMPPLLLAVDAADAADATEAPLRRRGWALAAAVVALTAGLVAAAALSGDDDGPGPPTSTTAPVLAGPSTTVTTQAPEATTTSTTEAPPPEEGGRGKPKDNGNGKGNGDEDDGDD